MFCSRSVVNYKYVSSMHIIVPLISLTINVKSLNKVNQITQILSFIPYLVFKIPLYSIIMLCSEAHYGFKL